MEKEASKSKIEKPKSPNQSLSKFSLQYKDTSGESSPESDGEDELQERGRQDQNDLPSEYWQIQKLVKYLKVTEIHTLTPCKMRVILYKTIFYY